MPGQTSGGQQTASGPIRCRAALQRDDAAWPPDGGDQAFRDRHPDFLGC